MLLSSADRKHSHQGRAGMISLPISAIILFAVFFVFSGFMGCYHITKASQIGKECEEHAGGAFQWGWLVGMTMATLLPSIVEIIR